MRKVFKWMREHMRPYISRRKHQGYYTDSQKNNFRDIIKKTKDETEVGVKFIFKF